MAISNIKALIPGELHKVWKLVTDYQLTKEANLLSATVICSTEIMLLRCCT